MYEKSMQSNFIVRGDIIVGSSWILKIVDRRKVIRLVKKTFIRVIRSLYWRDFSPPIR